MIQLIGIEHNILSGLNLIVLFIIYQSLLNKNVMKLIINLNKKYFPTLLQLYTSLADYSKLIFDGIFEKGLGDNLKLGRHDGLRSVRSKNYLT